MLPRGAALDSSRLDAEAKPISSKERLAPSSDDIDRYRTLN